MYYPVTVLAVYEVQVLHYKEVPLYMYYPVTVLAVYEVQVLSPLSVAPDITLLQCTARIPRLVSLVCLFTCEGCRGLKPQSW